MAATLTFDILARDRASATLNRVGGAAQTTGSRFKAFQGIATAAGLAAGVAVVKFGKDSINAFKQSQDAQVRLQDAFARFPALADSNIQAFQGLNQQLQLKTRFDDEAYASGQAILAQFKLTGKQILEVTPLLGDFAAKTGRDVPEAATLLGKAFLGNTRALKTLGISYKTTGNQALDTANIIDLVRQKVGGFAEKEGKTGAGQIAILGNKFEELQEKVGAKLLPALLGLATAASVLLDAFGHLSPEAQQLALVTTALGVAALVAGPLILSMAAAMKTAEISAFAAAGKIGLLGAIIVGVTNIAIQAKAAQESLGDSQDSLKDKFGSVLRVLVPGLGIINQLKGGSKDAAGGTDELKKATDEYKGALDPLIPQIGNLAAETQNAYEAQQRLNGTLLDATETDISFRDAVASWTKNVRDATKAGDKHTHSLSLNNQAGRDNISALTGMAKKVNDHAQAVFDQTGSLGKANRALKTDRERLLDAGVAAGFNRDELVKLINKYLKVPTKAQTKIEQPGMTVAQSKAVGLKKKMDDIDGTYRARVRASVTGLGAIDNLKFKLGQLPTAINISVGARVTLGGASFQHGTPFVPQTGWAMLHRGEAVIPAKDNQSLARVSGQGGSVVNNYITLNAPNYVGSRSELLTTMRNEIRDKGGDVQVALGSRR